LQSFIAHILASDWDQNFDASGAQRRNQRLGFLSIVGDEAEQRISDQRVG
jgi:hypothetical protein